MSDQFIGEIRMFAGPYEPMDWAFCDGRVLQISQYEALYALIGTTYGGNGTTTFNLPDLRGRVPIHKGTGQALTPRTIGQAFGAETVTLQVPNIPAHSHQVCAGGNGATATPTGKYLGNSVGFSLYATGAPDSLMNQATVGQFPAAAAQPHSNLMPTLCVNFIIATAGLFPTQS